MIYCSYSSKLLISLGALLISLCGVALGVFFLKKPERTIVLQQHFYLMINWRMEPVSLHREIRNTRLMGWLLVIVSVSALLVSLQKVLRIFS